MWPLENESGYRAILVSGIQQKEVGKLVNTKFFIYQKSVQEKSFTLF